MASRAPSVVLSAAENSDESREVADAFSSIIAVDEPRAAASGLADPARSVRFVTSGSSSPRSVSNVPATVLPVMAVTEDNLQILAAQNRANRRRIVQDPGQYRPATPILNWEFPRRSPHPPIITTWVAMSLMSAVQMLVVGLTVRELSGENQLIFLATVIPVATLIMAVTAFVAVTRHVDTMVELLASINSPIDMDRVVERLENGRFSRLREPYQVQVSVIRMFCRLLKYHHGVNPVSGEFLSNRMGASMDIADASISRRSDTPTLYSCTSGGGQLVAFPETPLSMAVARRTSMSRPGPLRSADPLDDDAKPWSAVMGVASDNKSLLLELLRQIKPGIDISKMPLPVTICEPRSLLEKLSDMFAHPDLFAAIGRAETSRDRLLAILRWYFSAFHVRPVGVKKPYNPVLGETFFCSFGADTPHEVRFFAEQVSHHPPVSVFTAIHVGGDVAITAGFYPKGRIVSPNCGASMVEGLLELQIPRTGETWTLALPSAYATGLLTGPPAIELGGDVEIRCSRSDFSAHVSFARRGWMGGPYDVVKGTVTAASRNERLYTIQGAWSGTTQLLPPAGGPPVLLFDAKDGDPPTRPRALPTTARLPSRIVWEQVTRSLRELDAQAAQVNKSTVEGEQREERRSREARGESYLPAYFRIVDEKKAPNEIRWTYIGQALI